MRATPIEQRVHFELPAHWPAPLHPRVLADVDHPTPYLITDLDTIGQRYEGLKALFPDFDCHYAMKCNSLPEVVETLASAGSLFEVASIGELDMLRLHGIDPKDVIYSNTVKPYGHIAAAHEAGVWRFAFDSEGELYKLAEHAPGSSVYVRLRVDDSTSIFPLSRKFGAEAHEARALLLLARSLGLTPHGVTFHVGSQCTSASAWRQAIAAAGRLMTKLDADGINLEMLNLGGGFPARYVEPVPTLEQIAAAIRLALDELLPYTPPTLGMEPGRYLVAESAVMATTVLGREVRAGENWLYVDVGAYHGLIETHQTVGSWRFPLWSSRPDHAIAHQEPFTVTGPTCDSNDTMFFGASLPSTLDVDDRLYIGSAGAYTLGYASSFNGFPPPTTIYVGD